MISIRCLCVTSRACVNFFSLLLLTSSLSEASESFLFFDSFVHHLFLDSHVLDRVSSNITLANAPEPVPVFGGANDLPQMDVHPSVAVN